MKKKTKIAIASIIATGILTGSAVYAAGGGVKKTIDVLMDGINLVVDGQTIHAENILYNGTTYVPVRALAKSLDREVKWDPETYTVEVYDAGNTFVEKDGIRVYTKTIRYKDEYTEVSLRIPVIEGMENSELMNGINRQFEEKAMNVKSETEKSARELAEECLVNGYPYRTCSVYTEYEVRINDNKTMSIPVTYYQYTGGAHGYSYKETVNLDLENEKELQLKDLFDGSKDYLSVLTDLILKQMEKAKDDLFPDTLTSFRASDDLKFYLTDDGMVVYFDPYEVAPYVAGIVEFEIPYESLKDVLKENYANQLLNN